MSIPVADVAHRCNFYHCRMTVLFHKWMAHDPKKVATAMSKQVAFLGIPPTKTFGTPTTVPLPTASQHTRTEKRTRKPRFRYILGHCITPSDCVERLLDTGIPVTGGSVDRAGWAFVDVSARLSTIGFKLGGPRFIDINLPTRTGYCLVLATSYVKGQIPDVDEELIRKVGFRITFLRKPYWLETCILSGKGSNFNRRATADVSAAAWKVLARNGRQGFWSSPYDDWRRPHLIFKFYPILLSYSHASTICSMRLLIFVILFQWKYVLCNLHTLIPSAFKPSAMSSLLSNVRRPFILQLGQNYLINLAYNEKDSKRDFSPTFLGVCILSSFME